MPRKSNCALVLALICAVALWLRVPGISTGLPYLYEEDEAHHFNRVVEMVKKRDLNPRYFHKPSLHFYLRMPIVALSYWWLKQHGEIDSLKDIRTRDSFGLAGYNFTASHPLVVSSNRALSVTLSLGIIFLAGVFCIQIGGSLLGSALAAALTALAPDLLRYSPTIGVDVVMTFMCMCALVWGQLLYKNFSLGRLLACCVFAGLAVSSKYNALPIFALPIAICWLKNERSPKILIISTLVPIAAFFAASPYILVSLPLFLKQTYYEVWHYAVAGHVGHEASPGLGQLVFYSRWLVSDGIGLLGTLLACAGGFYLAKTDKSRACVALIFPALFLLLMLAQKANFTRNVLILIPVAAALAGYSLHHFERKLFGARHFAAVILATLCLAQPMLGALSIREAWKNIPESRHELLRYLSTERSSLGEIALSGELQLPLQEYQRKNVDRINPKNITIAQLTLQGYDSLIVGPEYPPITEALGELAHEISGNSEEQRVQRNPLIRIFRINSKQEILSLIGEFKQGKTPNVPALDINSDTQPPCASRDPSESHCWLSSALTLIKLHAPELPNPGKEALLTLALMSPWPNQRLTLIGKQWEQSIDMSAAAPFSWMSISVAIPHRVLVEPTGILAQVAQIHSPSSQGLNEDKRRLGIAIRQALVERPQKERSS